MIEVFLPSIAGLVYLFSMGIIWWSAKRFARLLDRPVAWDAVDGVMGFLVGGFSIPVTMPMLVWKPTLAIGTSPEFFALRNAAALAAGMTIFFVILSICVEQQLDWQDVPESLDPIEERFWTHHMIWLPWSPTGGWGWT